MPGLVDDTENAVKAVENQVKSWFAPCTMSLTVLLGWLANPRWVGYTWRHGDLPADDETSKELHVYGAMHWACELLTFAALFVNIDSISLSPAPNVYYNTYPGAAQYDLAGLVCMAIAAFGKWFLCFWAHNVSFLWWAIWYACGWYSLMFSPYSPSKGLACSGGNSTCLNAFNNQLFGGSLTMNVTNTAPRRNYQIDEFAGVDNSANVLTYPNSPMALASFCVFLTAFALPFIIVVIEFFVMLPGSKGSTSAVVAEDVNDLLSVAWNPARGIENLPDDRGTGDKTNMEMAQDGDAGFINQVVMQAWIVVLAAIALAVVSSNFLGMSITTTASYWHPYYFMFATFAIIFITFAIFLSIAAAVMYSVKDL